MDDLPLQKLTISGPTLSSLINRFTSSPGDIEGLLFGDFSLNAPSLSDDDSPSPPSAVVIATVTGFISSGTTSFSALSTLLHHNHHRHRLIGWFSARRRSPLRPSLREFTVSRSIASHPQLSKSNCVFFLLTTPFSDSKTLIHTHEYKAFHFRNDSIKFDALPLDIVNIGPAFRGHYSAFCPNSMFPRVSCDFFRVGSPMKEDGKESESLNELKKVSKDQKDMESYVEGYEIGNLSRLIGSDAVSYMKGVEELYEKMLAKLGSLAKLVEISSARVMEQGIVRTSDLPYPALIEIS